MGRMSRKRLTPADLEAEGDAPPSAAPGDRDVDDVMRLLLWARAKGFDVGPVVRVGGCTIQVDDLRQTKQDGLGSSAPMPDRTIYEEHGIAADDLPVDGTGG